LIPAILASDLVLLGGGSLLQDVTSAHGIFYYLAVARIAQILGRKSMFIAQGIGPLVRPRSVKLTASVANLLDAITVRDSDSCRLLQKIGVTLPITTTADPALLLSPSTSLEKRGTLLSMRMWPHMPDDFGAKLVDAIRRAGLPAPPTPLNMHCDADNRAANEILAELVGASATSIPQQAGYRQLIDAVGGSEMVIGMRLHALIFAAASSTPCIALSYDPKVDAFMEQIGQSQATVDIHAATADQLKDIIGETWRNRATISCALKQRLPDLRNLAELNTKIASSLLI
jgi:polysaccharide pyruvyl transferase CsaB